MVVNTCSLTDGTGEFRGIIFSISPPIVSIPKESGVTSNKRLFEPFNNSNPCRAAPQETTKSGSRSSNILIFSFFFSLSLINLSLDEPPTKIIPLISESSILHSLINLIIDKVFSINSSTELLSKSELIKTFFFIFTKLIHRTNHELNFFLF